MGVSNPLIGCRASAPKVGAEARRQVTVDGPQPEGWG